MGEKRSKQNMQTVLASVHSFEVMPYATSELYLLKDLQGKPLALFKPFHSLTQADGKRELAAYLIDHQNFANVPLTVTTTFQDKIGSCQRYVQAQTCHDILALPAEAVRRLATLDIRLLNADRHNCNILVNQETVYPIDHSSSLPEGRITMLFDWVKWPQAFTPFTKEEKTYIANLKPIEDYKLLINELQLSEKAAYRHVIATLFLQVGMECGLKVGEIGNAMLYLTPDKPSFEQMVRGIEQGECCRSEIKKFYKQLSQCV